MTLCPVCGRVLPSDVAVCPLHALGVARGWAAGNRIMCDFFHRGIAPPRLSPAERDDALVNPPAAAA